jgi:hypothetical protein
MAIPDQAVEGLVNAGDVAGAHERPGQVRSTQGGAVGPRSLHDGFHGDLDALLSEELDHTSHPLLPETHRSFFVPVDDLGLGIHEVPEKMKLSLVQGAADFEGWNHLDRPLDAPPIQSSDASSGIVVRQSDDIQPGRLTAGQDILRG